MKYRTAETRDIPQIQKIRNRVRENRLSNPALVSDQDVEDFISRRGKGWVGESEGEITGFSIVDLQEKNVWALFIDPDHESKGIGKQLHQLMLDWYFEHTKENIWLGTATNTRAEQFYRLQGWKEVGMHAKGEIKFEMDFLSWVGSGLRDERGKRGEREKRG